MKLSLQSIQNRDDWHGYRLPEYDPAAVALYTLAGLHRHVADLAGTAVGARHDLAVDDHTAAHAGAQSEHDGAVEALAAALRRCWPAFP